MAAVVDQLTDSHCEPVKSSVGGSTGVPTQGAVLEPTGGRSPVARKPGSSVRPPGGGPCWVVAAVAQVPPAGPHWAPTTLEALRVMFVDFQGLLAGCAGVDDVEHPAGAGQHDPVLRGLAARDRVHGHGRRPVAEPLHDPSAEQPVTGHRTGAEGARRGRERLRRVLCRGVRLGDVQRARRVRPARGQGARFMVCCGVGAPSTGSLPRATGARAVGDRAADGRGHRPGALGVDGSGAAGVSIEASSSRAAALGLAGALVAGCPGSPAPLGWSRTPTTA